MADPNPADEFLTWLTPRKAEDVLEGLGSWPVIRRAILDRLKSDLITARAETYVGARGGTDHHTQFELIPGAIWDEFPPDATSDFWETGQFRFFTGSQGARSENRLFGVRFSPHGIARLRMASGLGESEGAALPQNAEAKRDDPEKPPLSKADAERFCRAVLAGWPDAGQDWAYDKAVLFFPDKRVTRDAFRSILRSIRGPTKPGKKPKTGE